MRGLRRLGGHAGYGLKRLRGAAPHTPNLAPVVGFTPETGVLDGQVPVAHGGGTEAAALRRPQAVAVEGPAGPLIVDRTQIAQAAQAQQPDHGPRHAVASGVPVPDGAERHAEEFGAGLGAQKTAVPQLPETFGGQVPRTFAARFRAPLGSILYCA